MSKNEKNRPQRALVLQGGGADYYELTKNLRDLVYMKGASEQEVNKILELPAKSSHREGDRRKYSDLLIKRFDITKIVRIERSVDKSDIANKWCDFSSGMWVGTISWVSSKPVELRLLYDYDFNLHPDAQHGVPPITQFQLGKVGDVAIALIKPANVITTGGQYSAGTESFVAKAVALHNIQGVPFTATYSVDATAKPVTK